MKNPPQKSSSNTSATTSGYTNPLLVRLLEKHQAEMRGFDHWPGRCWVISDGTMGMVSQCLALLKILDIDGEDIRAVPTPLLRLFPKLAAIPGWQLTLGRKPDWLKAGIWPDLLITCGKRMAGISIGVKRLSGGQTRTIHIQDPQIPPHYFDLLITPSHDHIAQQAVRPSNLILSTGALNRLDRAEIALAGTSLPAELKQLKAPVCAVMIGGHNRRYKAGKSSFVSLARQLSEFADILSPKGKPSFVLIPSRRTPKRHLRHLCEGLSGISYHLWDGTNDNPYPGILGLADIIIVTSDSVNMVSEACITGKPVLTAYLQAETGRIARFHQIMEEKGHILKLSDILTSQKTLPKTMPALDEKDRLASEIKQFFGLSGA